VHAYSSRCSRSETASAGLHTAIFWVHGHAHALTRGMRYAESMPRFVTTCGRGVPGHRRCAGSLGGQAATIMRSSRAWQARLRPASLGEYAKLRRASSPAIQPALGPYGLPTPMPPCATPGTPQAAPLARCSAPARAPAHADAWPATPAASDPCGAAAGFGAPVPLLPLCTTVQRASALAGPAAARAGVEVRVAAGASAPPAAAWLRYAAPESIRLRTRSWAAPPGLGLGFWFCSPAAASPARLTSMWLVRTCAQTASPACAATTSASGPAQRPRRSHRAHLGPELAAAPQPLRKRALALARPAAVPLCRRACLCAVRPAPANGRRPQCAARAGNGRERAGAWPRRRRACDGRDGRRARVGALAASAEGARGARVAALRQRRAGRLLARRFKLDSVPGRGAGGGRVAGRVASRPGARRPAGGAVRGQQALLGERPQACRAGQGRQR